MKHIQRVIASFAVTAALLAGFSVPATASPAKQGVDVTKLTAKSIVVSSYHCKNTEVTLGKSQAEWADDWSVNADITRGGNWEGLVSFSENGDKTRTKFQICPDVHGLGKFTIGPSDIWASSNDYTKSWYGTDWTKGSFYVRAKSYASIKASRKGSKVTLTVTAKRYSVDQYRKVNYSPKKVQVQVKSGKKWKTIKTVDLRKGQAKVTVKKKGKATYRYVIKQTNTTTGATSNSVKK